MSKLYRIHNYGNTRSVCVQGQPWEISKNATIETTDSEAAAAFDELLFIDVELVEQSEIVKQPKKKKVVKKKKLEKKVTTGTKNKKIKRRKVKRRLK